MNRKVVVIFTLISLLALVLYFVPLPQRVYVELPTISCHNGTLEQSSTHTLFLKAWRLDYLFQKSKLTGWVSLFSQNDKVLDEVKFTTSLGELGPLNTLGDVEYISISSYDEKENKYKVTNIYIATERQEFVLKRDNILYVAPSDNQEEADKILDFFREYTEFNP